MRKKADTDKTEKIEAELVSVEIIDDGEPAPRKKKHKAPTNTWGGWFILANIALLLNYLFFYCEPLHWAGWSVWCLSLYKLWGWACENDTSFSGRRE